ncbi:MAG: MerR family transcriptional regulator [Pyrinomonadaceae bacterium]
MCWGPLREPERIGDVVGRSRVSIDTLRHYERLTLLAQRRPSSGGFQLFALEHIERVQFIKQAQGLGFSLGRGKGLVSYRRAAELACSCSSRRAGKLIWLAYER